MIIRDVVGRFRLEVQTHDNVRFDVQPTNGLHRHNFTEICLVLSGKGKFRHGSAMYSLRPGDLFAADPGILHEISSHETRDLELWFLALTTQDLHEGAMTDADRVVEKYTRRHSILVSNQGRLENYLPLLQDEGDEISQAMARMSARYLALEMMQALAGCETAALKSEVKSSDPVDLALAYIDSRLDRPLGVEEIASAVGLSSRALRRHFVRRLGVGIIEETNHRRMRTAANFLLMGFAVGEVAQMVGISDPAQFTRAFRRSLGVAPKAFQANYTPGRFTRMTRTQV